MAALYTSMLGDAKGTEAAASRAVSALATSPLTPWHWTTSFLLRQVAELNRATFAVDAFDDEAISVATRLGRPDLATAVTFERARTAIERNDSVSATLLVRELRKRWVPQQSAEDQEWSRPILMLYDAQLIVRSRPAISVALLDSALRLTAQDDNDARRTPLRLALAESRLAAHDTVSAMADFNDLLQRLRSRASYRLTVFDAARLARVLESVSQLSASVLRARGDAAGALRALSGMPFVGRPPAPCCSTRGTSTIAIRTVRDSAWFWYPSARSGELSLQVVALPAPLIRAAIDLDTVALADVYDSLTAPFHGLAVTHDLCIDARGPAAQLPWSALRDRRRNQFLIERARIRLVTDALMGCGSVESIATQARITIVDAAPTVGPRALPAASREARGLKQLWGDRATMIDARKGSRPTLDAMSTAAVVHFAGHAVVDRVRPDHSYLYLGGVADSMIAGSDITARKLVHAPLVVLGACEMGSGTTGPLGGFDSVAGALLDAGASHVISALWPVDDAPTATLLQLLHAALKAGLPPPAALQRAQLQSLRSKDPTLSTPRVWAAFQIMGSEEHRK